MIPKKIHYCWFGENNLPAKYVHHVEGWRRIMPDFEFRFWNEENSPKSEYLRLAIAEKKWANASNWVRLHALCVEGGVYLDTDVEVLQSLERFLLHEAFVGFEVQHFNWDGCVNNAVFGSRPGHWFVSELLSRIEREFNGSEQSHFSSPHLTTRVLKENELYEYGRRDVRGVAVYPVETFYPYGWHEIFDPDRISDRTYTIHWYGRSWQAEGAKGSVRRRIQAKWNMLKWMFWKRRSALRLMRSARQINER